MSSSDAAASSTPYSATSHRLSQIRNLWNQEPVPFVTAYILSGLLAILIPAIKYRKEVSAYQNSYYYQYQQYNNNENGDGQDENNQQDYDVNNCTWYKFWCTSQWVNENGEYREQEQDENGNYYTTPSWFSGWGNGNRSGDRQSGDANAASSGSLKFVYAWQTIMFLGLLAYGTLILFKFRGNFAQSRMAVQSLFLLIFVWTNFCFLAMWLLANGSIYTEGREIEELGGFYLQFSVLMFISNFWQFVWGFFFCFALGIRGCRKRRAEQHDGDHDAAANKAGEAAPSPYFPYCEPTISITDSGAAPAPTAAAQDTNSDSKKSYSFV